MMHDVIQNGLEDYLGGVIPRDFQTHLDTCGACRSELAAFTDTSEIFAVFKESVPLEEEAPQPAPGFYYRLSQRIGARASVSPWSIFSVSGAFGRRVAFASLMTLALLGGFLVSRESDLSSEPVSSPEAIMASHDGTVPHELGSDRDRMMLTLATYQQ